MRALVRARIYMGAEIYMGALLGARILHGSFNRS